MYIRESIEINRWFKKIIKLLKHKKSIKIENEFSLVLNLRKNEERRAKN
jgi:hypothetical protein